MLKANLNANDALCGYSYRLEPLSRRVPDSNDIGQGAA